MSTVRHGAEARPLALGRSLFDHADDLKLQVPSSCGRSGQCHECIVEVKQGSAALSAPSPPEAFLRTPFRLACQAIVRSDGEDIEFAPLRRTPRIVIETSEEGPVDLDPPVVCEGERVMRDGVPIDRYRGALLGLAIDLGTTTVAVDLVDLATGRVLGNAAFENPQRFGGSDVMNRISYDGQAQHRGELQRAVAAEINRAIIDLTERLGVSRLAIYELAIAANSTMRDLFFKLDVQSIGQRPYKSSTEHALLRGERATTAFSVRAKTIGLRVNSKAMAYALPLVASHVGADAAADLLALDLGPEGEGTAMLVDIGTNTEVILRHKGRLIAASCPAGPAFEGGQVTYGMPAYEGAIEAIRFDQAEGRFLYQTIGGTAPIGLCGSGLIDLLATLVRHGRMTAKGVFSPDKRAKDIPVVPEAGITLSREDASNLAQAKAANYCGQFIVLRHAGAQPGNVERLYLAGGFARYVDVENAVLIGLLAPVEPQRVVKVGNASLKGARLALLSARKRRALEDLVRGIEHIELETTPDFFEVFVEGCQFKPMPQTLWPVGRHRSSA
ncbi:MAG: DUF4445 domain-containing protein [Alphaproteobacteria bacterium]|nr:DUF4445 domain-containing protein [Alphaproteobacteria bacterium]